MTEARRGIPAFFYLFAAIAILVNAALVVAQYRAEGRFTVASAASLVAAALLIVAIVFFARDRKSRGE